MAKKHSKNMKETEMTGIECEDCGKEDCQCGPCDGCGQMECSCEGGSCGGSCGSGCGGAGGCGGSYGNGAYGGWHSGKHKMFIGIGLIAVAVLWYAKNTGMLNPAYFWPLVIGLAGLGMVAKGMWMKHHMHGG